MTRLDEYWGAAGIAALVGVISAAIVSVWGVSRNIKHRSVTEERQRWRDAVRDLIPDLVTTNDHSARQRTRDAVVLRLNPYRDGNAVAILDRFVADPTPVNGEAVVLHFQDILKRDWERAKIEARFWSFNAAARADRRVDLQMSRTVATESPVGDAHAT